MCSQYSVQESTGQKERDSGLAIVLLSFFSFLKITKVMHVHGEKDNSYKSLLLAPSSIP